MHESHAIVQNIYFLRYCQSCVRTRITVIFVVIHVMVLYHNSPEGSRALRLETLRRLFFMKFCKKEFLKKTVLKNDCFQNLEVQSGQWLSFLCCYVVCEMEKTICPLPRLKFILNSMKYVHVPVKPQSVISATRGWEYIAKDYF